MSLNQDQIDIISNSYLISLYDSMEQQVIADIARRVKGAKRYTETAEIQARNMREQGYSTAEILKEVHKLLNKDSAYQMAVAENTKEYKQMVKQLIADTEAEALAKGDMLTAMAGDMSWNDDMQMWSAHNVDLKKDNALKQITDAVKNELNGSLMNITGTGKHSKGKLDCGGVGLEDAYKRQMDLAVIKMCTGNFSYTQAVKDCIKNLAQRGVTVQFDYGNGRKRNYHLDVAVRMCVRTASEKISAQVSEMNMQKTGQDLVYVSAHAMSRPTHAVWQGKVYVWNKDAQKKYPQYGDFWYETDYGSPTGLCGINCSHHFYPYWPGDVVPEFTEPSPVTIDGKTYTMYEATQEQRAQERNIRALKRERDGLEALGDTQGAKELSKKISLLTKEYTAFSNQAGLRPKYERMGIIQGDNNISFTNAYINAVGNKLGYNLPKGYKDTRKVGELITLDDLQAFKAKADGAGIRTNGFELYQGDVKVLNEFLEYVIEQRKEEPLFKDNGILLNYDIVKGYAKYDEKTGSVYIDNSMVDIYAFAETKGKVITLNKFMFDDTENMIRMYRDGVRSEEFASGTTYLNIYDHEHGHQYYYNNPGLYEKVVAEIEKRAQNENISIDEYIIKNVSMYAADRRADKKGNVVFLELIPELNSKARGKEAEIALEILRAAKNDKS